LISCIAAHARHLSHSVLEPVVEPDLADTRAVAREESALCRVDAVVARVGVGDDLARIVARFQDLANELVEAELLGPAISTMPFSGGLTATRPTPLATSSAAMGWKSAGGR
jgi:hypothetical protein